MIKLVRIIGFLLIFAGAIIVLTWLIEPFRAVWPWLLRLPLPIRIGIGLAATGLIVLLGSILYERWGERELDRSLLRDELDEPDE